ncbi:MAG: hypothetical protein NVS2B3_00140 [Vulcanimicrobiaceae bacterium]
MNKLVLALSLTAVPLLGFSGVPAFAADASTGTADCSKAAATMRPATTPPASVVSPDEAQASVDAAYLTSMKATLDRQNAMANMEVACGANATVKAHAKEALVPIQSHVDDVTRLLRSIGL